MTITKGQIATTAVVVLVVVGAVVLARRYAPTLFNIADIGGKAAKELTDAALYGPQRAADMKAQEGIRNA